MWNICRVGQVLLESKYELHLAVVGVFILSEIE